MFAKGQTCFFRRRGNLAADTYRAGSPAVAAASATTGVPVPGALEGTGPEVSAAS